MAVRVQVPSPLRGLTGGAAEVHVEASSVGALVDGLAARYPGIEARLREPDGALRRYIRIFVNDEDVRFLQDAATPLAPGDRVAIVPAIAGGRV